MTAFRLSSSRGTKPRTACTLIEPPFGKLRTARRRGAGGYTLTEPPFDKLRTARRRGAGGYTLTEPAFDKLRTARRRGAGGYTLVELLVVIAIIMILVTLLAPSLRRAREMMRRVACKNNSRCLAQAALAYNNKYGCLSPIGTTDRKIVWYQKEFLGQFFGEDVPKGPQVDGVSAPPLKSVLRCPSEAFWSGIPPIRSWIAYNSYMSYEFEPPGTNYECYFRGPKIEEIFNPPDRFLLFGDGRDSGIDYVSDIWAYNNMSSLVPESDKGGAMDARHEGGVNACFLDGHADFLGDPTEAYFDHKILLSTSQDTK